MDENTSEVMEELNEIYGESFMSMFDTVISMREVSEDES